MDTPALFCSRTQDNPDRSIRIFISSTFRDMQEEREELVKWVFPKVRKICEDREVSLSEVDLRWGITDEQKAEGQVLPICLQEIERCRPYFIGILGELYGWVPDNFPQDLIDREPWLAANREKSVTELEIIHGVLNNPRMSDHAFFYFRDPEYIKSIPEGGKSNYHELPLKEEIQIVGKDNAEKRAEKRRNNLRQLKEKIRKSSLPVRENYRNPRDFADLVFKDLLSIIDREFPLTENRSPFDFESHLHKMYVRRYGVSAISRPEYTDKISNFIKNDNLPLIFTGDPGSGKTTLLSYWIQEYIRKNTFPKEDYSLIRSIESFLLISADNTQKIPLVYHFVGASPTSNDWTEMLRHILGEIKKQCALSEEIPEDPEELRKLLSRWFSLVSRKGRFILIIDGLDRLLDYGGAQDLTWLPPQIPSNIRLILTTGPGKSLDALKIRGWQIVEIAPLSVAERKEIMIKYLDFYRKKLPENLFDRIAATPQTANALFLYTFLDEIRQYGDHNTLVQKIEYYLQAREKEELFGKLLERYETDYDRDRPHLVRDTLSCLWASRNGLWESELRDLLGNDGRILPQAHLSPLLLAMEQSLVRSKGIISFSNIPLRQAVVNRYAPTELERENLHSRLAVYFEKKVLNARTIEELPWQFSQARKWEDLATLLKDPFFFTVLASNNKFELARYWKQIEEHTSLHFKDAYSQSISTPSLYPDAFLWYLAEFLVDKGYLSESLTLQKYLSGQLKKTKPDKHYLSSLNRTAQNYYRQGRLNDALRLYEEERDIRQKFGITEGIPALIGNIALVYHSRGDNTQALKLFDEEEEICRKTGDKKNTAAALGNKAIIQRELGNNAIALELLDQAETIGKETDDPELLLIISINRANIFLQEGELDRSLKLYRDAELAARDLGSREFLVNALEGQAKILIMRGDPGKAHDHLEEATSYLKECGDFNTTFKVKGDLAEIYYHLGEREKSEAIYQEILKNSREIQYSEGIKCGLGNLAIILRYKGRFDEALAMQKEHEQICRFGNDHHGTAVSLIGQGSLFQEGGHPADALRCYSEAEQILRNLNAFEALATCLINKGLLLAQYYDQPQNGLQYAREAYAIASEHGFVMQARQILPLLTSIQQQSGRTSEIRSGYNNIISGSNDEILFLKNQLLSPGWETFEHAANTLGYLAKTNPEKITPLIPMLIKDLYSLEDRVASGSAFALMKISELNSNILVPSTQELLNYLDYTKKASHYEIIGKRAVIFVLGKSGVRNPSLVIPVLRGYINDPDEYVRKNAKEALEELSGYGWKSNSEQ